MTTDNMGLTLPTEDASDDVWDTLLNAALTLIDSHDHTDGNGVLVPVAGLNIDDDLAMGGNGITGITVLSLNAISPIVSGSLTSLFVGTDNELYWRTNGGTNVQVTDGNSLNASLLGGITGDYGAGDEEVNYSAGSGIYDFLRDDSPVLRGYIDCSDIRLFEATNGVTNAVKIKSPASLAASYTLTFPAALPAGQRLLQVEADGDIVASNTIAAATIISSTLNVTGAVDLDSTLNVDGTSTLVGAVTVTGLITANGGVTAGADDNFEVSGDGRYRHGTIAFRVAGGAATGPNLTYADTGALSMPAVTVAFFQVPVFQQKTITAVRVRLTDDAADPMEVDLGTVGDAGFAALGGGWAASSSGAGALQTVTVSGSADMVSAAYVVRVESANTNAKTVWWVEFDIEDNGV